MTQQPNAQRYPPDLLDIEDPDALYHRATDALTATQKATGRLAVVRARALAALPFRASPSVRLAQRTGLTPARIGQLVAAAGQNVMTVFTAWNMVHRHLAVVTERHGGDPIATLETGVRPGSLHGDQAPS